MGISSTAPLSIPTPNSGRFGSLLRVPIDYVLEVYVVDSLQSAVTLPNTPTDYEQKRPSATIITHTLNDVVREHTENHVTQITLKGVTGYSARLGHTRDGGVSSLLGPKILSEFDVFLNEYQTLCAKKGAINVHMVFRALNEEVAFRVEPTNWEWSESAGGARFSYNWTLELEAYGPAPKNPKTDILSPVTEALKTAQDQINRVAGGAELGATAIQNIRGELGEVTNTIRSVGRVATALQNVVGEVDGLRTFVTHTLPSTLVAEARRFGKAWEDAKEFGTALVNEGLGEWSSIGDDLLRAVGYTAETSKYNALTSAGLLGVSPETLNATEQETATATHSEQGSVVSGFNRSHTQYTWRAGDTLQSLALRAYGTTARWSEIAEFNGLRSPRQWGDGTPIMVGDTINVPQDIELETRGTVRGDLFGTDLAFDLRAKDITLVDDDIKLTSGRYNLEQALALRMLTEQGESYILPDYGLPVRVGGTSADREVAYLASHVRDQLVRDSRVRDVRDVSVLVEGDTLAVSVSLSPVSGDAITLVTPYMREV
jgi:nucleoid-associated protein YgaU